MLMLKRNIETKEIRLFRNCLNDPIKTETLLTCKNTYATSIQLILIIRFMK